MTNDREFCNPSLISVFFRLQKIRWFLVRKFNYYMITRRTYRSDQLAL